MPPQPDPARPTPPRGRPHEQVAAAALARAWKRRPVAVVVAASLLVASLIVLVALKSRSDRAAQTEREARQREEASELAAKNAETERQTAQIRRNIAAKKAAEAAQRVEEIATAKAKSAAMDRASRDKWIRECADSPSCESEMRDAIVAGAPDGAERAHARLANTAANIRNTARHQGVDGLQVSFAPAHQIADLVSRTDVGFPVFQLMTKSSLSEAKKDPDSARGGVVSVSGNIVEIQRTDGYFDGAIMTGSLDVVRFITEMSTTNLYQHSWTTFTGVVLQQYDYANVSGGQTRSILLVGAFDIPENHTRQ